MKILYITNHLRGTDGWSRYSLDLIEAVKKSGNEVKVIVQEKDLTKSAIPQIAGLSNPERYLINFRECARAGEAIESLIGEWQPAIMHFLVEPYANILPFISFFPKPKVFMTIHGTFSYIPNLFDNPLKKFLAKLIFRRTIKRLDRIVAVSNFTKKYFLDNLGMLKAPAVFVVTNGVALPDIKSYKKVLSPQIIFVGAVKERKGIKETIEALKVYRDQYSNNFSYVIIGAFDPQDDYYKSLCQLISDYNLEGQVKFVGRVGEPELERYYEESSLLILLPKPGRRFEGFGLVYLEAAARGLPVIGATGTGAPEAIKSGESGFVANLREAAEVAGLINKILNEQAIKKEGCLKWASDNRIELKVRELVSLYESND